MGFQSCQEQKLSDFDLLMKETMEIHNEDMRRMGEMMQLKSEVKRAAQSATPSKLIELNRVLDELEMADQEMMKWMRNFAKVFPDGVMSHEGMDSEEMSHGAMDSSGQPHPHKEMINHGSNHQKSNLQKLKDERIKMDSMSHIFNSSLDKAKRMLNRGS